MALKKRHEFFPIPNTSAESRTIHEVKTVRELIGILINNRLSTLTCAFSNKKKVEKKEEEKVTVIYL